MEHSRTANDHYYQPYQKSDVSQVPPWERTSSAKVPYIDASTRPLSDAERQALPDLWAANENHSTLNSRHRTVSRPASPYNPRGRPSASQLSDTRQSPALGTLPARSCNTSHSVPHGSTRALSPELPISNLTTPLSTSSGTSVCSQESRNIKVLPGTMSTGGSSNEHCRGPRKGTPGTLGVVAKDDESQDGSKGKKVKLALKSLFKKRSADEQELEKIRGRHWAEDSE